MTHRRARARHPSNTNRRDSRSRGRAMDVIDRAEPEPEAIAVDRRRESGNDMDMMSRRSSSRGCSSRRNVGAHSNRHRTAGRPRAVGPIAERSATEPGYLSLRSLAVYSGLSVRTLRACLTNRVRALPHYRIGGKILVRRSEFDGWANQFRFVQRPSGVDDLVDDVLATLR